MKSTLNLVIMTGLICILSVISVGAAQSRVILPASNGGARFFGEFALDGTLLRNLGSFPEGTRDYTPDAAGRIHTYTGTFNPSMMSQNGASWTSQTLLGWSTVNNLSYGGIVSLGSSVFVTDMWTAYDGTPQGIVRFSTTGGAPIRFAQSVEPIDIATDGTYLYVIHGNYWTGMSVYDPSTMQFVRSIPLSGYDVRSSAVKKNGELFTVDWDGNVSHLSPTGQLLDTLHIPARFSDINLDEETGNIILGAAYGQGIFITNEDLDSYRKFSAMNSSVSFLTEFASFQVPEPSFMALAGLGAVLVIVRKRR